MRRVAAILVILGLMSACADLSISPVSPGTFTQDDLLTGTWRGEAAGLRVTLVIGTGVCVFGCSNTGRGSWVTLAAGDTGNFSLVGFPPVAVNDPIEAPSINFGPSLDSLTAIFDYQMPDSSHLVGRISAVNAAVDSTLRPFLPVDSSFAITLTKDR